MSDRKMTLLVKFSVGDVVKILRSDFNGIVWGYQIVGPALFVTYLIRYMHEGDLHEIWLCETDIELVEAKNAVQEDNEG